ncbi:Bis(5'-nucleosyl)-tetraphosphatase, symmetrical [Thalassocella blandensis]|nr:Bis(5'-nucleosyl)-tetraphosphatase, symmetrical [Thalassocella blandensis]
MATYAVGDLQGCLDPLYTLLERVRFDPSQDTLWIAGDLVNRGPQSLATLRFVKGLGECAKIVLGNHDLHLLAAAHGHKKIGKKDTIKPILDASDSDDLLNWLQTQPLLHHDPELGYTMVHAGIPPIWSINEAQRYADEIHTVLRSDKATKFFAAMYGDKPDTWDESLSGPKRWRLITNYFTRMRFCTAEGKLELDTKTGPESPPKGYAPWYSFNHHRCTETSIIFGHWASLMGNTQRERFIALDTGCVWGGSLTMMCLDDRNLYEVKCDC